MTAKNTSPAETLLEQARRLPIGPGVYLWLDDSGTVLYIGKAKNLRSRVLSYFRGEGEGDGRAQVPLLMAQAAGLDYIVTGTEIEALITEANLVHARKPKYNVRLKDDKRFPYVKVTNEPVPRIIITRTLADDGGRYLGPYTDASALRRMVELVHDLFPLRRCEETLPAENRTRACLNHQIGRCSGPCMEYISLPEYHLIVQDAVQFLLGKNDHLIRDLTRRMQVAADETAFEHAASLRDTINAIRKVNERRQAFSTAVMSGDWDAINFAILERDACVVIIEVRDGLVLGKKDIIVSGAQYADPPVLMAEFLTQYYLRSQDLPPEIHLSVIPDQADTLGDLLTTRRSGPCRFIYPQRGEKLRLLDVASRNAESILKDTIERRERQKEAIPHLMLALKRDLMLAVPPRTIACIDISHLHGTDTVASLVFFRDGRSEKGEYRHFRIETAAPGDDFAAMREVVRRYYIRRVEEEKSLPDLLMVDGGKGQLSSACGVLADLGLGDRPAIGLAKRLEEVFLPGASDPQNIPKTSSTIHFLQRVRDEAHRFAVTYQRARRTKRTISTALTEIPGIGPTRARTLLRHFGSLTAVKAASLHDLAALPGIGQIRAEALYTALHGEER